MDIRPRSAEQHSKGSTESLRHGAPASASSAYTATAATALCSWRNSKAAPQAMPSLKCHTQLEPKRCDLPFELRELQTSRVLQMSQAPDLPLRPPKDWIGRGATCVT